MLILPCAERDLFSLVWPLNVPGGEHCLSFPRSFMAQQHKVLTLCSIISFFIFVFVCLRVLFFFLFFFVVAMSDAVNLLPCVSLIGGLLAHILLLSRPTPPHCFLHTPKPFHAATVAVFPRYSLLVSPGNGFLGGDIILVQ